jgi:L-ascorbate metabolism protein UlaG (beta-lactamase superfamily)
MALMAMLGVSSPARALFDCGPSVEELASRADIVVQATIAELRRVPRRECKDLPESTRATDLGPLHGSSENWPSQRCGDVIEVRLEVDDYLMGSGPVELIVYYVWGENILQLGNCPQVLRAGGSAIIFLKRLGGELWAASIDDGFLVATTQRASAVSAVRARNLSLTIAAGVDEVHPGANVSLAHSILNMGDETVSFCVSSRSLWSIVDSTDCHVRGFGRAIQERIRCEERFEIPPYRQQTWIHELRIPAEATPGTVRVYAHLRLLTSRSEGNESSELGSTGVILQVTEPDKTGIRLVGSTPPGQLRVTFIGNMGMHFTDGRVAVLTDFPYESGAFGYMTWTPDAVPTGPSPLCVISHAHADHFEASLAREYCGSILGPKDVARVEGLKVVELSPELQWEGITIRPIPTPHADIEHYSFLIEWGGLRLYLTGDTEDLSELVAARDLDVAFVSPWLLASVSAKGQRIDARQVIVYHHGAGEKVVEAQERVVPAQGQVLDLGSPK